MTPAGSRDIRSKAFEIKFIVDGDLGQRIREAGRQILAPDPWGGGPASDEYLTTTIYFDTDELAVYGRQGSFSRAKYRIRRYGQGDLVYLERKLRTADVLSKRRTSLRMVELARLDGRVDSSWSGLWFHERVLMRRLAPRCQVSYSRTARVGLTDTGPIRLTLDDSLAARRAHVARFEDGCGFPVLNEKTIVEMKFTATMPAAFRRLVEDYALEPVRVSKYRLAIERVGLVASKNESRSDACDMR